MEERARLISLMAANAVCSVISTILVYHAFRDWPVRYAHGALSLSVTAYFVLFVVVSLAGAAAVALYARSKSQIALRIAAVPAVLAAGGFVLGLTKLLSTGDF
jgi:hypothetical protein